MGSVRVSWQITDATFELQVKLPATCGAEVELPDGVIQRVQSGEHSFVMEFSQGGDGVPTLLEVAEG